MRTASATVVLSVLALGLSGEAKAGALSDLIGKFPMPTFSLNCLEPADKDAASGAAPQQQRDRRESLPAQAPGELGDARPRSDDPAMPATVDTGADKSPRGRTTKWKALLPGALK